MVFSSLLDFLEMTFPYFVMIFPSSCFFFFHIHALILFRAIFSLLILFCILRDPSSCFLPYFLLFEDTILELFSLLDVSLSSPFSNQSMEDTCHRSDSSLFACFPLRQQSFARPAFSLSEFFPSPGHLKKFACLPIPPPWTVFPFSLFLRCQGPTVSTPLSLLLFFPKGIREHRLGTTPHP